MRRPLFAVIGIAACMSLSGCPDDDDDVAIDDDTRTWRAELEGEPGWEQLGGVGEVVWVEGANRFTTSVDITGDEEGAVRPWHLHFNTCEAGGPIVGQDGDYPRLVIGADGTDSQTVTINRSINPDAPHHINVHLSDDELETIIACADVIPGADPAEGPADVPPDNDNDNDVPDDDVPDDDVPDDDVPDDDVPDDDVPDDDVPDDGDY